MMCIQTDRIKGPLSAIQPSSCQSEFLPQLKSVSQMSILNICLAHAPTVASSRKCEISITISTDSYSATPRKYIRSFVL